MKQITSDALDPLDKALGLSGAGSPITELQDASVEQVLDVGTIVRRGRTLAGTEGIFTGMLRNIHAGATSEVTTINPYEPGTNNVQAPYPLVVPPQFELWLYGCIVRRNSGAGDLTSAALTVNYGQVGFGLDSTGGGGSGWASMTMPLAYFNTLATEGAISFGLLNNVPYQKVNLRLPRSVGINMDFRSTSDAAATFTMQLILGLFPIALGQDAAL